MRNKRILYISRAGVPTDAPGIRMYNIAKILREIGCKVDFICDREDYISGDTQKKFDGFNYYFNERNIKKTIWRVIFIIIELMFANNIFNKIKKHCEKDKPYAIILYNDIYSLTKKLTKYCKDNDIRLVADVTEWYGKRNSIKIGDKIVPYMTDKRIKKLDRKVNNIISISPYLHNYYLKLECNSIFVPPVFDIPKHIEINKYNYYSDYVLNLVYAGSPGNKDILNPVLDAVSIINMNRIRVRLDLVGVDSNYLKDMWKDDIDFNNIAIVPHGRLPHSDTLSIIKKADFGILLRHDKRYAKAGFSTKFAECMANGVAMICNSVGGADLIINQMNDGILIDQLDTDEIIKTLRMLVEIDKERILSIRNNAYSKAVVLFNSSSYVAKIEDFIHNLREVCDD